MNYNMNLLYILFNIKKEEIEYDWMGFKITDENYISCHHIVDIGEGGTDSLDNMAILSKLSQYYLHHFIEYDDKEIYDKIALEFKKINERKKYPTIEELKPIIELLNEYEIKHYDVMKDRIKFTSFNEKKISNIIGKTNITTPQEFRLIIQSGVDPEKKHKKYVNRKKKVKGSY